MNDNIENNNSTNATTYRATSNLNTAINNPTININNTIGRKVKKIIP